MIQRKLPTQPHDPEVAHDEQAVSSSQTGTRETPVRALLMQLTDEMRALVHQEVEMAKAEISASLSQTLRNIIWIVAGAVIANAGFLALVAAASVAISAAVPSAPWLGPLIIGVVVAGVGAALILKGSSALAHRDLVPHQTIDSIRENREWIKDRSTSRHHDQAR